MIQLLPFVLILLYSYLFNYIVTLAAFASNSEVMFTVNCASFKHGFGMATMTMTIIFSLEFIVPRRKLRILAITQNFI